MITVDSSYDGVNNNGAFALREAISVINGVTTSNNALGGVDTISGAGIRFVSDGALTLRNCAVSGNRTEVRTCRRQRDIYRRRCGCARK